MAEIEPAEVVKRWMFTLADKIADQADAAAADFKDVSGDEALRAFARSIRNTNARAGFVRPNG